MILFPQKLHKVLDEAKYESIISWQPHGRSFKVHKRDEFVKIVLPLFAKSGRTFASFMRQLNYYGFKRYDVPGPDKGSYYHPHFLHGCFDLCKDYMSRKQSVLDKKSVPDGIENLFDVNKGLSSLPITAANTIPIHSSRESSTSNQLNGTTSPTGWSENVDPKELSARPPYHGARFGATHRHNHYEPQLQNENLPVPPLFLGREIHPRDIRFSQIAHRSRGNDHNPQDAQLYNCLPSWTTGHNTPYNSSHLQQKSHGGEEFQGISCNPNHYYEKQRQDSGQGLKGYREVLSTLRNFGNDTRNFSRSSMHTHCNCGSKHENKYQRQGGTHFGDSFYVIDENRIETMQQRHNDFSSSYVQVIASGSRGHPFLNASNRQVSHDAVNDLIVGKESNTFSSIQKQQTEEIEPVPDTDILKILDNNSLKVSDSYELDSLMQASFSFP